GKKPFVEDEKRSAMHKIRLEKHLSARKLNPEVPRELERVIDKCLEKQPRDRWRSAQHMVMALERFLAKHVEMNHHGRLVLFLRANNVITELEAEEYLNSQALGGEKGGALPNMQARHAVRSGLVAHAVTFGVLALIIGLIHVAPLQATPVTSADTGTAEPGRGFVKINATPWANITIDETRKLSTPLGRPIELGEGAHRIVFTHDAFAPITRDLDLPTTTIDNAVPITVDFCKDGKPTGKPVNECGAYP
ncbi:MAG: hypothetical protein ABI867_24255, partial [Kofleriaceae bacterium]